MAVVLFNHPGVRVPKILCHDEQRHPSHDCETGPRVAQPVEADRGVDLGSLDCFRHWAYLLRFAPITPGVQEDQFVARTAGTHHPEKLRALVGQCNVIFLFVAVSLSCPDADGSHVRIKIGYDELRQLAVPRASLKRSLHEGTKIGIARVDQPLCIIESRALSTPLKGFTLRHATSEGTIPSWKAWLSAALRIVKTRLALACRRRSLSLSSQTARYC
jgi:hypothetical protein